jgi:hydrogenase expression/formation protein HypC
MCLAIPGEIVSIQDSEDPLFRKGKVSFEGVLRNINFAAVPEAKVGDYVLVHVGMALSVIDEEEALKTLEYFKEIDELNNEIENNSLNDPS